MFGRIGNERRFLLSPANVLNRTYVVYGRVQGVGFRWWTRQRAQALGLAGWVQNRPDGSVEIHAGGDDASITRLESELECGPKFSVVERVEKADATLEPTLSKPFVIK